MQSRLVVLISWLMSFSSSRSANITIAELSKQDRPAVSQHLAVVLLARKNNYTSFVNKSGKHQKLDIILGDSTGYIRAVVYRSDLDTLLIEDKGLLLKNFSVKDGLLRIGDTTTVYRYGTFILQVHFIFLAPPVKWQRSFTNSKSSVIVVVRHPSSVNFSIKKGWFLKNCPITFFLILHRDSMAWGLPAKKCWTKGPPGTIAPVAVFRHFAKFLKICPITFSLFWHGAS